MLAIDEGPQRVQVAETDDGPVFVDIEEGRAVCGACGTPLVRVIDPDTRGVIAMFCDDCYPELADALSWPPSTLDDEDWEDTDE